MWLIGQILVVASAFGISFLLLKLTGDPVVSGVFGALLGVVVGVATMILVGDMLDWLMRKRT